MVSAYYDKVHAEIEANRLEMTDAKAVESFVWLVRKYNAMVGDDLPSAAAHVVIEDGNMDYDNLKAMMDSTTLWNERCLADWLVTLPECVRNAIWDCANYVD